MPYSHTPCTSREGCSNTRGSLDRIMGPAIQEQMASLEAMGNLAQLSQQINEMRTRWLASHKGLGLLLGIWS